MSSSDGARIPPLPEGHLARAIAIAVQHAGGRAWMVGGSVRDALLGRTGKDIDLEVHGLTAATLEQVLRRVGPVQAVGRSFGVYKVGPGADAIDVAIPRVASAVGGTAKGDIQGDPFMGLEAACQGRDLTINAIVADPLTGEVVDPTGGVQDLRRGCLEAVAPTRFGEDPLRVVRVARFAATHQLIPSDTLVALCQSIDTSAVATERHTGELERALVRSTEPGVFATVLHQLGAWSSLFPHQGFHPTIAVHLDRAAALRPRVGPPPRDLALMLAALTAHAPHQAEPTLAHLGVQKRSGFDVRRTVLGALNHGPRVAAATPKALDTILRKAAEDVDVAVTIGLALTTRPATVLMDPFARATTLGVLHAPLAPLIFGRDLLDAGVPRGRILGELLQEVRAHQLEGAVCNPEDAILLAQRLWTQRSPSRV